MRYFRIIQTRPLTHVLPYEVQERRQLWSLLWPVWRSLKDSSEGYGASRAVPRRFPNTAEARHCIERRQAKWDQQQTLQEQHREELRAERQLPRVVEVLHAPAA